MRLLEHEAKDILKKYHIQTSPHTVVFSPHEVEISQPVVIKAQIPLGGRGKAGGILKASDEKEAGKAVKGLLGRGLRGYRPARILIEEQVEAVHEFFMAITYDTVAKAPVAVFSRE